MSGFQNFIKSDAYIDGRWVKSQSGAMFAVLNPANQKPITEVPNMNKGDTEKAVKAASDALADWRTTPAKERGKILKKWAALIEENIEELTSLLTEEQGKPRYEAKGEILHGKDSVIWFAEEARRVYGDIIEGPKTGTKVLVTKEPVGVVAAITPWNFPSGMITRKVAPALAAGCTIILKPSEEAPLSALALAILAEEAGIPAGVLNIVTCDRSKAAEIGDVLSTHPAIRKISFTGSTAVGKKLMEQAAGTVKRVSLELGGNAPYIVFESADIERAVNDLLVCKFRNAGQTCVCANRIYVQDTIYDAFKEKLIKAMDSLVIGNGQEDGTKIGPLINKKGLEKVQSHIKDAVSKGGKVEYGGNQSDKGELFIQPTVISGMKDNMIIKTDETFGPVAALFSFEKEEHVITEANDTNYGLAAYAYTNDMAQSFRVMEALEYGMVAINEPIVSGEAFPFGGVKESGIGRENSKYGIEDYIEIKYGLLGGL